MSYNIDNIAIISKSDDFGISPELFDEIAVLELCEGWDEVSLKYLTESIQRGSLPFYGESSGWAFESFCDNVLCKFSGTADMLVTWAGGDSHTGLRVRDGKVTQPEVIITLDED